MQGGAELGRMISERFFKVGLAGLVLAVDMNDTGVDAEERLDTGVEGRDGL